MGVPNQVQTIFTDNLRRLCEALQVSTEGLARSSGLDEGIVALLLTGERTPTVDELACIARALQIDPESLIEPGTNDQAFE